MPRSENGGIIGPRNFSTQNYAIGVYQLKSQFVANAGSQWPRSGSLFLGVAHATSPYVSIYPFSSLGFGTKLTDPVSLPTGTGNGIAFAADGKSLAIAHATTPFISAYPFSGAGIGVKYSNPGTLPAGTGNDIAFRPQGDAVVMAHTTTPYLAAYPWSAGFGTKYSDPATLSGTGGNGVTFGPNGNDIAVAGSGGSPYLYVYRWSSGFGTKYSDHASILTASVNFAAGLSFHPSGNYIAVAYNSSGTISSTRIERTYGFVSGTGFTASFYDTSSTAAALGAAGTAGVDLADVSFSPSGNDVVFCTASGTNYVRAYSFNTSTGFTAVYTDPATNTTGAPNRSKFSPDGNFLAAVHTTTPFVTAWPWTSGTGFGTKLTNPNTLPPAVGNGLAWGVV